MTYRTTTEDVQNAHRWFCQAASAVGHDVSHWRMDAGSPTYGRAWRTYVLDPTTGAHHTCPVFGSYGYVGFSKSEAVHALRAARAGLESAADMMRPRW